MLRGLLRVQTSTEAVELLHQTVRELGGRLVLASENDTDARAAQLVDRVRETWILVAPLPITFSAGIAAVSDD